MRQEDSVSLATDTICQPTQHLFNCILPVNCHGITGTFVGNTLAATVKRTTLTDILVPPRGLSRGSSLGCYCFLNRNTWARRGHVLLRRSKRGPRKDRAALESRRCVRSTARRVVHDRDRRCRKRRENSGIRVPGFAIPAVCIGGRLLQERMRRLIPRAPRTVAAACTTSLQKSRWLRWRRLCFTFIACFRHHPSLPPPGGCRLLGLGFRARAAGLCRDQLAPQRSVQGVRGLCAPPETRVGCSGAAWTPRRSVGV